MFLCNIFTGFYLFGVLYLYHKHPTPLEEGRVVMIRLEKCTCDCLKRQASIAYILISLMFKRAFYS